MKQRGPTVVATIRTKISNAISAWFLAGMVMIGWSNPVWAQQASGLQITQRPLSQTDFGGPKEVLDFLDKHGLEANSTNADGDTLLHIAAAKGWDEVIYPACAAGSDPRLKNAAGLTAHEVAVAEKKLKVLGRLAEAEMWYAPQTPVNPAPDFSVKDINGADVNLSSFRGRTVALFFFCKRGKHENYEWLDYAQKIHDSPEGKQGEIVVLAATPESAADVKAITDSRGYNFQILSDPKDTIRKTLGLYAMPAVLIDANGAIRWKRRMAQRIQVEDDGLFLAVKKVLGNSFNFLPATTEKKPDSEQLLYDFEDGYQDWKITGKCWEKKPATDALYPGLVKGYVGRSFLSTYGHRGGQATGLAISPDFEIKKQFLHLLVGGGDFPDHCAVALVCDGCTVRRAEGDNTAELSPVCWNVADLIGKQAHFEVYDSGTVEPRDFIMLDHVVASDSSTLPTAYEKRFDPDDQKDSAAVADAVPADYKSLRAGEFHEVAIPGPTYRLERTNDIVWSKDPEDWLEFSYVPSPTHHAQSIRSFFMTLEAGGKTYSAHPIFTGRPFMPETYVCSMPANLVPDRQAHLRITCEMMANRLQIVPGAATDKQEMTASLGNILTSTYGHDYKKPAVIQFMYQNKLWRWPGESDASYMLRAYRYFQRYFTYVNVPWGGWPNKDKFTPELELLERRACDCGLAESMVLLLRANGIPAHFEQGYWVGDNGVRVSAHVKTLVFIRKVGWLWFGVHPEVNSQCDPFDIGSQSNDNFIGEWLNDLPEQHPIPNPPAGIKVGNGSFVEGSHWWCSWLACKIPEPSAKYLLKPRDAKVTDGHGNDFVWQSQCQDDIAGDHYLFGGWAPVNDRLDYTAYGMASIRGVMKPGIISLAHPDGNTRQIIWPIKARAGQMLRFTCCLTDRAVKETRRGVKIQVNLSGDGQNSELINDELPPKDPKVIEVAKILTGSETSLTLKIDNCGREYWTVVYCDAKLE